jgi:hypothetical protein
MIPNVQALTAGLSNIALITPASNVGYQGIFNGSIITPTFLFHTEGEQKMELKIDITDHYIESNSAIQDHSALPPIKYSTHGFIGELNDLLPFQSPVLQAVSSALVPISDFAPGLSVTALNLLNEASSAYSQAANLANAAASAWNSLSGQGTQNKQQAAFQWWAKARIQRWLFNIQTPWALMLNMMPESIVPLQSEETTELTDFFITFKEIRFSNTTSTPAVVLDGRAGQALSPNVDLGTTTPSPSSIPFVSSLF